MKLTTAEEAVKVAYQHLKLWWMPWWHEPMN